MRVAVIVRAIITIGDEEPRNEADREIYVRKNNRAVRIVVGRVVAIANPGIPVILRVPTAAPGAVRDRSSPNDFPEVAVLPSPCAIT